MNLFKIIKHIKYVSISLFLFSLFSLVISLWLQNTLSEFKFTKKLNQEKLIIDNIIKKKINCFQNIEDCRDSYFNIFNSAKKLGDCNVYINKIKYVVENKTIITKHEYLFADITMGKIKPEFDNKNIEIIIQNSKEKSLDCIKNYKYYNFYKIFPFYYEYLYKLKTDPKTTLGASTYINPFLYGETSISNIVKRYPISYVFKTLLYISVILMFFYWFNYNNFFKKILKSKKNKFFYFGISSSVFLFFHLLFLGVEIDSKIFVSLRKIISILFILSEVIAQALLTVTIIKNKNFLLIYCRSIIINIKIFFIILMSMIAVIIILILIKYNLVDKFDYILEWNYFAALLFYYFLSFLLWKKLPNNPSTS